MSAPSQVEGSLALHVAPTCDTSSVHGTNAVVDPVGVAVAREVAVAVAVGRAVAVAVAVARALEVAVAVFVRVAVLRLVVVAVAVALAVLVAVAVAVAPPLHVPLLVHQLSVLGLNGEFGGQSRLLGIGAIVVYFVLL
jgi:hypothetical protein